MNLFLTKPGRLRRKDNTIQFDIISVPDEADARKIDESDPLEEDGAVLAKHALPIEAVDAIYLFNETTLNTRAIAFLAQKGVPVHVFNYYGHHVSTILPHADQLSGDLVIQQSLAHEDMPRRVGIARSFLDAAMHNILHVMQYYARRKGCLNEAVGQVRTFQANLSEQKTVDQLMGLEGQARRAYYDCWNGWLGEWAREFTRQYHPPDNPLNAMISFLNSLLYSACVSEIYRTALYPGISYLHSPQTRRFSLALDLCEPFKPILVDRLIFRMFDRQEIGTSDFRSQSNGVLLTDEARRKVITAWDEQLRTTVDYPALNRSVSYRQLIRLDCYKLIKHLLEGREFKPYRMAH